MDVSPVWVATVEGANLSARGGGEAVLRVAAR